MSVKSKSSNKPWTDPDDAPELTEADMLRGIWQVCLSRPKKAKPWQKPHGGVALWAA